MLIRLASAITLAAPLALAAVGAPAHAADVPAASEPAVVPISRAEAKLRPVLRVGSQGIWVRRLHRALHVTPAAQPFGQVTARAVRQFRVSHGMRPRTVVNVRLWMRLGTLVTVGHGRPHPTPQPPATSTRPVLQQGMTSAWVRAVQVALGVQPPSGYFGPITAAAVRAFQTDAGIPVTGIVDAATWAALGSRVVAPQADVTTTEAARNSREYRASIGVAAFAGSPTAQLVIQRESGGQCDVVSPGGTYRGKWQMDAQFWSYYGGTAFAARADLASCDQQDRVAYRGWIDRWWQPWPTAAL